MKTVLHRITAVIMALMVCLSTVSWTVEKHLCMGRVVAMSWFTSAEDCGEKDALHAANADRDFQNSCCADESFTVQGQDVLKHSGQDSDLEFQYFLVAFAHSYLTLFTPLEALPIPHEKYPPPVLIEDIQLLDQVFLI